MKLKILNQMNLKLVLIFVLLMTSFPIFSQNSRFSLGIEGSPTFNNILYSFGDEDIDQSLKDIFRPKMGSTIGAPIIYQLSDRLSFHTGLYWTIRGHLREEYFEHYPTDWSENPDYVNVNVKLTVNQQFIEVPIGVKIEISSNEKGSFYSSLGITANFPVIEKNRIYTYFPDHTEIYLLSVKPHEKNFRNTYFSCFTGFGFEYRVSARIGLSVEPYFNYMFGDPELFSDVNWLHSYYLACKIGARYYL